MEKFEDIEVKIVKTNKEKGFCFVRAVDTSIPVKEAFLHVSSIPEVEEIPDIDTILLCESMEYTHRGFKCFNCKIM